MLQAVIKNKKTSVVLKLFTLLPPCLLDHIFYRSPTFPPLICFSYPFLRSYIAAVSSGAGGVLCGNHCFRCSSLLHHVPSPQEDVLRWISSFSQSSLCVLCFLISDGAFYSPSSSSCTVFSTMVDGDESQTSSFPLLCDELSRAVSCPLS